jgi:hypothetical protein
MSIAVFGSRLMYSRGIVDSHAPESCVECSRIIYVKPHIVLRARPLYELSGELGDARLVEPRGHAG